MQDEHRPCAFADDEIALPMAGLAAALNPHSPDDAII
jgi:hypothetical protein